MALPVTASTLSILDNSLSTAASDDSLASSTSTSTCASPLVSAQSSCPSTPPLGDFHLPRPDTILKYAIDLVRREAAAVSSLSDRLQAGGEASEGFSKAIEVLATMDEHAKIIVTGLGKSSIVGRKAVATMCSLGIPAVFVDPIAALHGDIGIVSAAGIDVALIISFSGRTAELQRLLPTLQARCRGGLVALTGDPDSPLARAADAWLDGGLANGSEADTEVPAPSSSALVALAQLDALALCLLRLRMPGGWLAPGPARAARFAFHHEGGQLGLKLKAAGSPTYLDPTSTTM